jgi:uncharacterized protein YfkK (UPF0435 family)
MPTGILELAHLIRLAKKKNQFSPSEKQQVYMIVVCKL